MLKVLDRLLDVDLVIFDKDGTLIDFRLLWHAWYNQLLSELERRVPFSDNLARSIAETLGYRVSDDYWEPEGPLTLAPISTICILMAGQLYRFLKLSWNEAVTIVAETELTVRTNLPLDRLVQPVGDVASLLRRLRTAGIKTAVATGDIRQITEASLRAAGILELFDIIICADDGIPVKPAPDAALAICARLQVAPSRAVLVGDTGDDLVMARAAGLRAAIGVTTGATPTAMLLPLADILIRDIHQIEIVERDSV